MSTAVDVTEALHERLFVPRGYCSSVSLRCKPNIFLVLRGEKKEALFEDICR